MVNNNKEQLAGSTVATLGEDWITSDWHLTVFNSFDGNSELAIVDHIKQSMNGRIC